VLTIARGCGYLENKAYCNLPLEDLLFSGGGGFLFGALAGYAIKKVLKIAAVVVGLFVAGLAFLAYKDWIDVKWMAMENGAKGKYDHSGITHP